MPATTSKDEVNVSLKTITVGTPTGLMSVNRAERNALLYAETCAVDYSGLLEGIRMNAEDLDAFDKFKAAGLLDWGRLPARFIGTAPGTRQPSHWITLTDAGWNLAHYFRREVRAKQISKFRQDVDAVLAERNQTEQKVEG